MQQICKGFLSLLAHASKITRQSEILLIMNARNLSRYSTVAVGLIQEVNGLGSLCGWRVGTWGYHSDDGSILTGNGIVAWAPSYGPGQVVGVTFDPSGKKLRFTLDGSPVGKSIFVFCLLSRACLALPVKEEATLR